MIDSELKIYHQQIFSFCKSVVIKSDLMALQAKDISLKLSGKEVLNEYENPYFINLCGEYSHLDTPIYIIENGEKLLLNQTLLNSKPWLRKKYQIYGSPFEKLLEENPGKEVLLRYIISPPYRKHTTLSDNIDDLVDLPNLTLLSYDTSILETQERYPIVETLKQYVDYHRERWGINTSYGYEELTGLYFIGIFYAFLPDVLLAKRVDNIKTRYAHTYHIWNHLRSYGLEDYRTILTIEQQLFLYKNIEYIVQNAGKHGTLAILIEKILSQNYLSIEPKMLVLDYPKDYQQRSIDVAPLIVSRTFDTTPISQYFDADTLTVEQFYYNLYSDGHITKNDYSRYGEVRDRFSYLQNTTLQTKFLELKRNLPHHPQLNLLYGMMVAGLIHFLHTNRIKYSVNLAIDKLDYNENLDPKQALLLTLYLLQKENNTDDPKIPSSLKVYPYVRNITSFSDENIKLMDGNKKVSDFIDINLFKERYQTVDDGSDFNFNTEPMEIILQMNQLVLEDLMIASSGDYGMNEAINKLHNQLFRRADNNQVSIFDLGGTSIKLWFQNNYYTLFELINKIESDDTVSVDGVIEQLLDGLVPSSVLSDSESGIRLEDDYKYNKLRDLFVQLCSYNVVFIDPNIKNQNILHHRPLTTQVGAVRELQGLSNITITSYVPVPFPSPFIIEGQTDPKMTGYFVISGQTNDPDDELVEYTLEMSRFEDFSTIEYVVSGTGDMTKGFIGVNVHTLPVGKNLFARVRYRSDLLIWKLSDPSSGIAFNTGMINPPVIHFPEVTEFVDKLIIKTPTLSAVTNKVTGRITTSKFETAIIQVEGFSILLTASAMSLSYGHKDQHIESRWYISKNQEMTNLVYDSGWVTDDLVSHKVPWDKTNTDNLYFAVKFKGLRFGESSLSNIGSFDMRALKKPVITNVDGSFDPLTESILDIFGDDFTVVGDYPDVHDSSRWVIAIDADMQKVIYDSGWVKTALEEIETPLLRNIWAESFNIKTPVLSLFTDNASSKYRFKTSSFDFIPLIGADTPEYIYITVQYKGRYFGPSEVSDPFMYPSTLAPRGSIKILVAPPEAVTAGAKWRLKNTDTWRTSGHIEEFLPVDAYRIEFDHLPGYHDVEDIILTVVKDEVIEYTVTFEKEIIRGNLKITIEPDEAAAIGGWWRRKNTVKWNVSDFIETGVLPGTYEIEIRTINGYSNRIPMSVTVESDLTTSATYTYELVGEPSDIVEEVIPIADDILSGSKKAPPANVTITVVGGGDIVVPGTITIPYGDPITFRFLGSYKLSSDPTVNTIVTTATIKEQTLYSVSLDRVYEDCTLTFNHGWFQLETEEIGSISDTMGDYNALKTHTYLEEAADNNPSVEDGIISGSKRTPIKPVTLNSEEAANQEEILSGSKWQFTIGANDNDRVSSNTDDILSGSKQVRLNKVEVDISDEGHDGYIGSASILYGFKSSHLRLVDHPIDNADYTSASDEILGGYKRERIVVEDEIASTSDTVIEGSKQVP